jgi:hypothetical protein
MASAPSLSLFLLSSLILPEIPSCTLAEASTHHVCKVVKCVVRPTHLDEFDIVLEQYSEFF